VEGWSVDGRLQQRSAEGWVPLVRAKCGVPEGVCFPCFAQSEVSRISQTPQYEAGELFNLIFALSSPKMLYLYSDHFPLEAECHKLV
jgi:hypothetical protein